jgi:MYXO-CTERM domain-containing protein
MFLRISMIGSVLAVALPARATWSVVAVDPVTREVGVAVASCVPEPSGTRILPQVAGLAPGIGALAAQAQFNQSTRDRALASLRAGMAPQAILDDVISSDSGSSSRQYGVVTLAGGSANHTGSANSAWAGAVESRVLSVQGNILVGPDVVAEAQRAFEQTAPCEDSLADKLLRALEAGASRGGDSRCPAAQPALVAVLRVASPSESADNPALNLLTSSARGGESPVALLRKAYESYRRDHPATRCVARPSDGGAATPAPMDGGRSAADASNEPRDGALTAAATRDGSTRDGSMGDGAVLARDSGRPEERPAQARDGGSREAAASSPTPPAEDMEAEERPRAAEDTGCSAADATRPSAALALLALLFVLPLRRRTASA